MSSPTLFIAGLPLSSKTISSKFLGSEQVKWLYCGRDYLNMKDLAVSLGPTFQRIESANILNSIAHDIREEYVDWIDDLSQENAHSIFWWLSSLPSKNVYVSNLYHLVCLLELIKQLWEDQEKRPHLVVVESHSLLAAILQWAQDNGIKCKTVYPIFYRFLNRLRWWGNVLTKWAGVKLSILVRLITASITRGKRKALPETPVIIDSFVLSSYFSSDGAFCDHFLPYLHEYLASKGEKVLIHPALVRFGFNYLHLYNKMRESSNSFIIPEDYLALSDYLGAIWFPFYVLSRKVVYKPFRGFSMYDLIKEEETGNTIASGSQAFLFHRLFLRLKDKVKPRLLIDWYENQIIDKALIGGFRKAFPEVKVLGVQMFISSEDYLNLFPSAYERESLITPHEIVTMGAHQQNLIKTFCKDIPCFVGASLRNLHVFDKENESAESMGETSSILALLPHNLDLSIEILDALAESISAFDDTVTVLVKHHPIQSIERIKKAFYKSQWPRRFSIFSGNLSEALSRSSLVVSSNSSSLVEALARGIPVLCCVPKTNIYHDFLAGLEVPHAKLFYSSSELTVHIKRMLYLTDEEKALFKEKGRELRDLFFTPMTEETLAPFLPHEKTLQ